jgi:sugar lactone lactonase YvrE
VAAALYNPLGVTLDASGNLFIAEQANYDVRRVDMQTGTITTVAGDPTNANAPVSGNNDPATKAVLGDAEKVVFDASGNMFISSWGAQCIWEVKAGSSTIIRAVGNGQQGYKGDGGPATSASISDPDGIGFDAIGNMYIAESANSVVRKVTH